MADRKVWRGYDDDDSAHPCVEHIAAIDAHDAETVEPFEERLVPNARVHDVKNRIAILEQQFVAQGGTWTCGATRIVYCRGPAAWVAPQPLCREAGA